MRKRKIYISGQITGLEIYEYSTKFNNAEIELINIVIKCTYVNKIINPLYVKPLFGIKKWFFFMITDIWELLKCNEIYMLNNWEKSRGAKIEHAIANMLKYKIMYQPAEKIEYIKCVT